MLIHSYDIDYVPLPFEQQLIYVEVIPIAQSTNQIASYDISMKINKFKQITKLYREFL